MAPRWRQAMQVRQTFRIAKGSSPRRLGQSEWWRVRLRQTLVDMSAALTVRRSRWTTALVGFTVLLVLALAGMMWQYQRATRATVPDVPQRVEGFEALGGSAFAVGGRHAAAAVFGREEQRLTYAIVSGVEHVNYYDRAGLYGPIPSYVDGREL